MIITGELISGEFGNADIKSNIRIHCTSMHTIYNKGETIHRMYRNHDYFGDSSVHDTWRPLTIQCSFLEKK
jgi:hypothetical protein